MNGASPSLWERTRWAVLFLLLFAPFGLLAVTNQGMVWADEIFQSVEQAHRLAFGYGWVPWEFQEGARFWLFPALLLVPMKILDWLGLATGPSLVLTYKLLFALATAAAYFFGLRLARRLAGWQGVALLLGLAVSFPATLLYGHRALSEVASAPLLMGLVLLLAPVGLDATVSRAKAAPVSRQRLMLAGALAGLLTLIRFQNALLLPVLVLLLALRHRVKSAVWVATCAIFILMLGGAVDAWLWGKPFHSFLTYWQFNVGSSGANLWGVSPPTFFLRTLLAVCGPWLIVLALGFLLGLPALWPVALLFVIFLFTHSWVPHKELRFLFPVLPLFLLVASVGIARGLQRIASRYALLTASLTGLVFAVPFAFKARSLTFEDLGQPMNPYEVDGPRTSSAWTAFEETNRLLWRAGGQVDLCGLAIPKRNAYWTGGYTYLHRRVPMLWQGEPGDLAAANYVVLAPGTLLTDGRYQPVAGWKGFQLLRREGPCSSPPAGAGRFGRMRAQGIPGL